MCPSGTYVNGATPLFESGIGFQGLKINCAPLDLSSSATVSSGGQGSTIVNN